MTALRTRWSLNDAVSPGAACHANVRQFGTPASAWSTRTRELGAAQAPNAIRATKAIDPDVRVLMP